MSIGVVGFLRALHWCPAIARYAIGWPWPQAQIAGDLALNHLGCRRLCGHGRDRVLNPDRARQDHPGNLLYGRRTSAQRARAYGLVFAHYDLRLALVVAVHRLSLGCCAMRLRRACCSCFGELASASRGRCPWHWWPGRFAGRAGEQRRGRSGSRAAGLPGQAGCRATGFSASDREPAEPDGVIVAFHDPDAVLYFAQRPAALVEAHAVSSTAAGPCPALSRCQIMFGQVCRHPTRLAAPLRIRTARRHV